MGPETVHVLLLRALQQPCHGTPDVTPRAGSPGVQTGAARRHPLYSGERQRTRGAERSAGPDGGGPRAAVRAVGTRRAQRCEF